MTVNEAEERRGDQELLGLEVKDERGVATVELGEIHVAPFGRLYGGAGTALASAVIEAAAGRRLLWVTTQFVGICRYGDRLDLQADVVAAGKRTSQVRVCAYAGDALVSEIRLPALESDKPGFFGLAEQRHAGAGDERAHRWWMRLPGRPVTRPALLGLAGDCVPQMVMREIGEPGAGTSLDNTIRVGTPSRSEWVLIDGAPEQAVGGYGHGWVRLWAQDGTLVGTASQTAALWRSLG
jgi:acyl-CoA thioesterase